MGRNPNSVGDRKAFRSNLTGILLMYYMRRSFTHTSISERKLFPTTSKKTTQSTSIAHITSSKNREHSLLNYTMNMVHRSIIRPTGGIKQHRRGRPTATPLSTLGYSSVVRFGQVREQWAAPFNGVLFWEKFGRRGV